MEQEVLKTVKVERLRMDSSFLGREVLADIYISQKEEQSYKRLLLINDGQDLVKMPFDILLDALISNNEIQPLVCVGIHAGTERRMEYGTARQPDYMQRGAKAGYHEDFVLKELLPQLKEKLGIEQFDEISYAGFSLGGLSAIDVVWNHPSLFKIAGVFSGSLWWRSKDLNDGYNEETDRIMHRQVKEGKYHAGLRFYFTTGSLDETADRNGNGIIDSIDDTLGIIEALKQKGYTDNDIRYINYEDGRHDVETWARAFPDFLKWGWGLSSFKEIQSP
ncbi:MAG TPA: alpha/beta hydrolase-fold protein, partial [Flavisolibacter sp.]|nr:alpha/beta hydrolase-fold protein [Flavisolibacter sp.]